MYCSYDSTFRPSSTALARAAKVDNQLIALAKADAEANIFDPRQIFGSDRSLYLSVWKQHAKVSPKAGAANRLAKAK